MTHEDTNVCQPFYYTSKPDDGTGYLLFLIFGLPVVLFVASLVFIAFVKGVEALAAFTSPY